MEHLLSASQVLFQGPYIGSSRDVDDDDNDGGDLLSTLGGALAQC